MLWFSRKLAPGGSTEDGCHPEAAQALQQYLDRTMNAQEAAHAMTQHVVKAEDPMEHLAPLWAFLMDALVELPSTYMELLLALLEAIESLPTPNLTALPDNKKPSEPLWKGLPGFGHLWADLHQTGNWREYVLESDINERKTMREEHMKKARIEAELVSHGLANIPIDWGYEVVADALESEGAIIDFEVPAAAEWFVLCGQQLRYGDKSWALRPRITPTSYAAPRDLYKADPEGTMDSERWEFWKKRLITFQDVLGPVRDAVTRALSAMDNSKRGQ